MTYKCNFLLTVFPYLSFALIILREVRTLSFCSGFCEASEFCWEKSRTRLSLKPLGGIGHSSTNAFCLVTKLYDCLAIPQLHLSKVVESDLLKENALSCHSAETCSNQKCWKVVQCCSISFAFFVKIKIALLILFHNANDFSEHAAAAPKEWFLAETKSAIAFAITLHFHVAMSRHRIFEKSMKMNQR